MRVVTFIESSTSCNRSLHVWTRTQHDVHQQRIGMSECIRLQYIRCWSSTCSSRTCSRGGLLTKEVA